MALDGTYSGLQASIAGFLHRSDLASVIPDLVSLAEERIARDLRLRSQVTSGSITTTAGQQSAALPTGWLEFENVSIVGSPNGELNYVNIQHLQTRFPDNGYSARPVVYSIEGQNILLGPVPDAAYTLDVLYYKRLDPLATTPANWLLTNHPSVYLFGALAEAQPFIMNDDRVQLWESKYRAAVNDLQAADTRGQFSGAVLRTRTI